MKTKEMMIKNKIILLLMLTAVMTGFMFLKGINQDNYRFLLELRGPKVAAIFISGACVAVSTLIFQTITNSRILTPSVMGLDSMYGFFQTMLVFMFKRIFPWMTQDIPKFFMTVAAMIGISLFLQKLFTGKERIKILYMVLIGMVAGTFLSSISSTVQMLMDPNEFLILQSSMVASFNKINPILLIISALIFLGTILAIEGDMKKLDVLSLGYEQSINLGLDYKKIVRKLLIAIAILVSISTALVGPITFLGLLTVNISKELFKTYKHSYLAVGVSVISILALVIGQFMAEKVFNNSITVGTIINFAGGIYLMGILLKERKIA